ncbi:hypothetical protein D3C85_1023270 [compost metagenome]
MYGTGAAHLIEVVAHQVDNHQVLRPILLRALQLQSQPLILDGGVAPGASALDWPGFDGTGTVDTQKRFGRCTQYRKPTAGEKGTIGYGADIAHALIRLQCLPLVAHPGPIGQTDFVRLPINDVLQCLPDLHQVLIRSVLEFYVPLIHGPRPEGGCSVPSFAD